MSVEADKYYVKSLIKAISVIKSFTATGTELGVLEIANKVGTSKSTAHRILTTLVYGGLLEQSKNSGKYAIGPMLYSIGNLYLETAGIVQVAEFLIKTLGDMTEEAITLAIRDRANVVFVMVEESKYGLGPRVHVGSIVPIHCCAIGRALMSDMTMEEIDILYPEEKLSPLSAKTIDTKTTLKLKLMQQKRDGVSLDSEGVFDGIEGIAHEVRDNSGKVIAAIGAALPIYRMHQAKREMFKILIKMGSSLISYRLGHNGTVPPIHDIQEIRSWWMENKLD